MKKIKIILEPKEAFALAIAGIKKVKRRRLFGTIGITKKMQEQIRKQIPEEDYAAFYNEWKSFPRQEPDVILPTKKKELIVKDF